MTYSWTYNCVSNALTTRLPRQIATPVCYLFILNYDYIEMLSKIEARLIVRRWIYPAYPLTP